MTPPETKEHLERLAERQGGRIHHRQLTQAGIPRDTVRHWLRTRWLIRIAPRVYALGYARGDRTAQIWDALLVTGPGAGLTGAGAAFSLGLLFHDPHLITVATPRRSKCSLPGVIILSRRHCDREVHDGLPYVSMPELLLELAREGNVPILRRALEALDYRGILNLPAVHRVCGKGRRGSCLLREALTHRLPELALTKSMLEIDFLLLLEARHLPMPRVNQPLHGVEPDMYWPELNLVVELDGRANHHSPAQKRRDQTKDTLLRSHGITVIRLSYDDVHRHTAGSFARLAAHGLH